MYQIIAVGKKMPSWVNDTFCEYQKRLPSDYSLQLVETPKKTIQQEAKLILAAIPKGSFVIALDEKGKQWNTAQLSIQLQQWRETHGKLSFIIGGPDGLAPEVLERSNAMWSLSQLTFPHPLVRVVVAEQLYRAWSLQAGHPYHRA